MIARLRAPVIALPFLLAACAPRAPAYRPRLAPAPEPVGIEHQDDFERRLHALNQSTDCDEWPPYAVLDEEGPGGTYLGFCDGLMIELGEDGGSMQWGPRALAGPPEGWETRAFAIGAPWVRTELPRRVQIRHEGAGVRLVGKDFDVHVRIASAAEASLTPPERCDVVASGRRFIICRHAGAHRAIVRVELGSQAILIESEPRLRATLEQAGAMVRAAQLMRARRPPR